MRPSAGLALNDMSTRVRTSLQLVGAIARTARRHKELLLFPVLSLFATASLFLGIAVVGPVLIVHADGVPAIGLIVAFGLLALYLQHVSTTFFNVALTFAAFRALREEHTSPRVALAHALARVGAIMAYSAAAIAAGVLVAPLALIPRSRTFFSRLLPSLGVAWSVVPLLAIPVLVREPRGGLAAIRRAVTLFRERWGETSIAVVGLNMVWLPIAAASVFVFQHSPSNPSGSGGDVVWLGLSLVLCATPILIDSFVSSMYGSALYVFAVEGVVPDAFDTAERTTVWRVGNAPAAGGAQAPGLAGDVRAARGFWWGPVVAVAAIMFAVMARDGGASDAAQPFRQLWYLVSGSRPGLAVNEQNFPERLRMVWSRELPDRIFGLTVRPDAQVVAGAYPTIFVLDRIGNVIQQFDNHPGQGYGGQGCNLMVSASLPGTPGTSLIVSGIWSEAIGAYDSSGARRWSRQTTEPGDGVDAIAAISVPGQGDFVTVGYNGFKGLCLLDAGGVEQWCNKSIGNVSFVATIDCDRDGRDDILSKSSHSHPFFGSKLGCYSTEGKLVADLNVPVEPYGLRTFDARGNRRKDLIASYQDGLSGPLVVAAWTPDGQVLTELRLQTAVHVTNATISAAKLHAGKNSDIAVALADGWVVGTSLDGERWGHHIVGADGLPLALAALDVDDDGAQELIIASGKTVSAWTWNGRAARERP
jgi:Family of unknown function (DUF6159)